MHIAVAATKPVTGDDLLKLLRRQKAGETVYVDGVELSEFLKTHISANVEGKWMRVSGITFQEMQLVIEEYRPAVLEIANPNGDMCLMINLHQNRADGSFSAALSASYRINNPVYRMFRGNQINSLLDILNPGDNHGDQADWVFSKLGSVYDILRKTVPGLTREDAMQLMRIRSVPPRP